MDEVSGNTPAYSDRTQTGYPSWDALVEAESNGYVVVAVLSTPTQTWPWVEGPFETKDDAERARVRLRNKLKREQRQTLLSPDTEGKFFVRPAWKPDR